MFCAKKKKTHTLARDVKVMWKFYGFKLLGFLPGKYHAISANSAKFAISKTRDPNELE